MEPTTQTMYTFIELAKVMKVIKNATSEGKICEISYKTSRGIEDPGYIWIRLQNNSVIAFTEVALRDADFMKSQIDHLLK